jgi:phospholipid/cholesterol/gamma-HCH transport system permease protein
MPSPMTHPDNTSQLHILHDTEKEFACRISGSLDRESVPPLWRACEKALKKGAKDLVLDARELDVCDAAGEAFLRALSRAQKRRKRRCQISGLTEEIEKRLDAYSNEELFAPADPSIKEDTWIEACGRCLDLFLHDLFTLISFTGELAFTFGRALMRPSLFRWKDVWSFVESGGINALGIVLSLSFLMGLIMAFQAAIPMRQFGAEVFVADLVALSMLRELGPLMTAVILAGRSGSSFAAEIGTMKVSEELDALRTMGLNPMSFLVINRVLAVVIFTPVLTVLAGLAGLAGGAVVFRSLGFPLVTYVNQILNAVALNDFLGGFLKSFAFAFLIAAIGCLRGLETQSGSRAVGISATRAVVSGLTLIVVVDGIFAVIYYYLGI